MEQSKEAKAGRLKKRRSPSSQHGTRKMSREKRERFKQHHYLRQNGTCALCFGFLPFTAATLDHIIPVTNGGSNDMSNFQVAHGICNSSYGAKLRCEKIE